jgi:hypothetical protein
MGWGYNPFDATSKIFGGGVRADPYCLVKANYLNVLASKGSNCYDVT